MNIKIPEQKIICIAGSTGFIGKSAAIFFQSNGFKVVSITRKDLNQGTRHITSMIDGSEMLINVVGASIQKKWTKAYKKEIYNSRIITTKILIDAIKLTKNKPKVFVSSSAVGIYNSIDIHDEFSEKYSGSFLGKVCRNWEREAFKLMNLKETRLVIFRYGIVLGRNGGAFPNILRSFKFFLGSVLGDGYQWFPFVHIEDVLSAYWFVLVNKNAHGIYNVVVPNLVPYNRFCQIVAKTIKRPCWLKIPFVFLKLRFGEFAAVLTEGQHVKPHRLIREGFYFQYPTAEKTVKALLHKK